MTLGEALDRATKILAEAGVETPRREARLLAAHHLGVPATSLLDPGLQVDEPGFGALVTRRAGREPLALITGRAGFWTLDLAVSRDTLVPRADSETLIEAAIAALPDRKAVRRILDLGTGTGCLLLAALTEFPASFGLGIDRSPGAARLARRNALANGFEARVGFAVADWAKPVFGLFDLVLCNPPYIPSEDLAGLMPEVALHEPASALSGGMGGLEAYGQIVQFLPSLLTRRGVAVLELGIGQEAAVLALAKQAGLAHVTSRPDLAGIQRALVLCLA